MIKLVILIALFYSSFSALTPRALQENTQSQALQNKQFNCTFPVSIEPKFLENQKAGDIFLNQQPHSFNIFLQELKSESIEYPSTSDQRSFNKVFKIAAKYFKLLIKVTNIVPQLTKYYSDDCDQKPQIRLSVPIKYEQQGFSQHQIDSVIFLKINRETEGNAARSAPCNIRKWVTYGFLEVNPNFFKDSGSAFVFHQKIKIIMHAITHIYLLHETLYDNFYVSYQQLIHRQKEQVITPQGSTGQYKKLVTPLLKEYLKAFFQCDSIELGAVLQKEGILTVNQDQFIHFHKSIFHNDFMAAGIWEKGSIVTPLTLWLFKDSGFFHQIDTSLSDSPTHGKGKGCQFAMNFSKNAHICLGGNSSDQNFNCGQYGFYGGSCQVKDVSTFGKIVDFKYFCSEPKKIQSQNLIFTPQSKCFQTQKTGSSEISCLPSFCSRQGIEFTYKSLTYICKKGQGSVKITQDFKIKCPAEHQDFCAIKTCNNWCSQQGLCIGGQCIMLKCQDAIPGCTKCQSNQFQHLCKQCQINSLISPDNQKCGSCQQVIKNCEKCTKLPNGSTRCQLCKGEIQLGKNGLTCNTSFCQTENCSKCEIDENGYFKCLTCKTGYYPFQQNRYCKICDEIHQHCQKCVIQQKNSRMETVCQKCDKQYYLTDNFEERTCLPCQKVIDKCSKCASIIAQFPSVLKTECLLCDKGFLVSYDQFSQRNQCISCYQGCAQCTQTPFNCSSCSQNYTFYQNRCYLNPSSILHYGGTCKMANQSIVSCGIQCQFCTCSEPNIITCLIANPGYKIQNNKIYKCPQGCKNCQFSGLNECLICFDRYVLLANKSCSLCSSKCGNCSTTSNGICVDCPQGFYLEAQVCNSCIDGCVKCSKTFCQKCQVGRYYNWRTNSCQECVLGCGTCSPYNISQCLSCPPSLFLDTYTSKCQHCISNCIKCLNQSTCIQCQQTFKLNSQGKCRKRCQYPCLECTQNDSSFCISCLVGFQLKKVNQNKLTCQQSLGCPGGSCSLCPFQTRANIDKCEPCNIFGCLKCDASIQQCQQCLQGNYKQQRYCRVCPKSCQTCISGSYCLTCAHGFTKIRMNAQTPKMMQGVCQSCRQPCLTCVQSISNCLSCISGYEKIGNKCIYTDKISIIITFDISVTDFMSLGKPAILRNLLLKQSGEYFEKNRHMFSYIKIRQGSTVVQIEIVNPLRLTDPRIVVLPPDPCIQADKLRQFLINNYQISGMQIVSMRISVTGNDCSRNASQNSGLIDRNQTYNKTDNDNDGNIRKVPDYSALLWIVLAIVVSLLVLFTAFCVFMICCVCKRGKVNVTELLDSYKARRNKQHRLNNQIEITEQNLQNKNANKGNSLTIKDIQLQEIEELDEEMETNQNMQQHQSQVSQ